MAVTNQELLAKWNELNQGAAVPTYETQVAFAEWAVSSGATEQQMLDTFGPPAQGGTWADVAESFGLTLGGTTDQYTLEDIQNAWRSGYGYNLPSNYADTWLRRVNSGEMTLDQLIQMAENNGIANGFDPYSGPYADLYTARVGEQQPASDTGADTGGTGGSTGGSTGGTGGSTGGDLTFQQVLEGGVGPYDSDTDWFQAMFDEATEERIPLWNTLSTIQDIYPDVTAEDVFGYAADQGWADPIATLFGGDTITPEEANTYVNYINALDLTDEQKQTLLQNTADLGDVDTYPYTDPNTGMIGLFGSYMNQANGFNPVNTNYYAALQRPAGMTISDYYGDLAANRAGGILGQGLMTAQPTVGSDAWNNQQFSEAVNDATEAGLDLTALNNQIYSGSEGDSGSPSYAIDYNSLTIEQAQALKDSMARNAIMGVLGAVNPLMAGISYYDQSQLDRVIAGEIGQGSGITFNAYPYGSAWDGDPLFSESGSSNNVFTPSGNQPDTTVSIDGEGTDFYI